jgi:hypothetical protein
VLELNAQGNALPLGYEAGERLSGSKEPQFTDERGELLYGAALEARLAQEGTGSHSIIVGGSARTHNAPVGDLHGWNNELRAHGPLTLASLSYAIHQLVREISEAETAKDGTPDEFYLLTITVI